jgi:hypothetical protein
MHQRVNDCGCVETWTKLLIHESEPALDTYNYWLTVVCDEHIEGHRRFLNDLTRSIEALGD